MATSADFQTALKDYWESPATVSIIDKNLHRLEIDAVSRHLSARDRLADIGCGNGAATIEYAQRVASCVGFERSSHMRAQAEDAARRAGANNLTFEPADILSLTGRDGQFDVVVSQRMLINLASWEEQMQGLLNIHRLLRPGGKAILIENTNQSFSAMNRMRADVGLEPVPQHWHNRFFDHDDLIEFFKGKFQLLEHNDFGLYYFLTRVYTQMFAKFEGYGIKAKADAIFQESDRAARIAHERFGNQIRIGNYSAFGPIQVFVLRREGKDL